MESIAGIISVDGVCVVFDGISTDYCRALTGNIMKQVESRGEF